MSQNWGNLENKKILQLAKSWDFRGKFYNEKNQQWKFDNEKFQQWKFDNEKFRQWKFNNEKSTMKIQQWKVPMRF